MHLYAGLLVGVYFAVIGLTGSLLVFRPEAERAMALGQRLPDERASTVGPLQAAWNNLRREYPGQAIAAFAMNQYPGSRPGDPYRARVLSPTRTTFVWVDAASGQVLGAQHPAIVWLQNLHFNLFAGRTGLIVNAAGAVLFVVMALTGAIVWWPGRRQWRRGFTIRWAVRWPALSYDLHSAMGIVVMVPLAAVSAAGVYLVKQSLEAPDPQQVAWQSNVQGYPVTLDDVVRRGASALPGGVRVGLFLPDGPDAPFRFDALDGNVLVRVLLDQQSGEIVQVTRVRDQSVATWMDQITGDVHYGRVFGMTNRVLWVILGLVPPVLFITGVMMWWNRTASKWWRKRGSAEVPAYKGGNGETGTNTQPPDQ